MERGGAGERKGGKKHGRKEGWEVEGKTGRKGRRDIRENACNEWSSN